MAALSKVDAFVLLAVRYHEEDVAIAADSAREGDDLSDGKEAVDDGKMASRM